MGRNTLPENDTGQINTGVFTSLFIRPKIMRRRLLSISATIFTSLSLKHKTAISIREFLKLLPENIVAVWGYNMYIKAVVAFGRHK